MGVPGRGFEKPLASHFANVKKISWMIVGWDRSRHSRW